VKFICVFILLFVPSIVFAETQHPIDIELDKCLEGLSGNSPMANCTYNALEAWDKELNRVYKDLMGYLTDDGKKQLRFSQRQWIAFRDAEVKYLDTMYNRQEFGGSMYIPILAMNKLMITKERVLVLTRYLKMHQH